MSAFVVDTRGVFTVHKAGCAHLRISGAAESSFEIDAYPKRSEIVAELAEFASGEDPADFVAFAPCLKALR